MSVDAAPVVGPVVERMIARRLGRAGATLGVVLALGLVEWALRDLRGAVHATAVVGPVASAVVLLAIGFRGVRRAFGDPVRPWMTAASAAVVIPFAFALWLLTIHGLRGFATSEGPSGAWVFHGAWTLLGILVLRDTTRVLELERFATTMILPSPGEGRDDAR